MGRGGTEKDMDSPSPSGAVGGALADTEAIGAAADEVLRAEGRGGMCMPPSPRALSLGVGNALPDALLLELSACPPPPGPRLRVMPMLPLA